MAVDRWQSDRVWICRQPVDMRKSIDGLSALVKLHLEMNRADGSLCIFCNRARDKVKLLIWDRNGYWLLYKRLDKQRFHWPDWFVDHTLSLSPQHVEYLLDGYNLNGMRPHRDIRLTHTI